MRNSQHLKKNTSELEKRVAENIERYSMFSRDDVIAVGFSGGRDSSALLDLLHSMGYEVRAVHIHHGIRGAEADRDEEFCRAFCLEKGIPYMCRRFDVPTLAEESGKGTEECARDVRYSVFDSLISSGEADRVATAHHARDNLETVLYNMARGSGISGMCGIPPVRGRYVRPMISASPDEIDAYVRKRGIEYMTDSTNADINYTRNRIRAQVIPALESVNGALYAHVNALCEDLRETQRDIDERARNSESTDIAYLKSLDDALLRRVLMRMCSEATGLTPARAQTEALLRLVRQAENGRGIDITSTGAYIDCGRLCFGRRTQNKVFRYPLILGENRFDDLGCTVYLAEKEIGREISDCFLNIYKKLIHTCVNSDKINDVYVRSLAEGDKYKSLGMTRMVRKLIASDGLPRSERAVFPVFCDGEGVLWVPGHGVRDGAYAKEGLHIYYFSGVKHNESKFEG